MARFLRHSLAAVEPGYLARRRGTLVVSQLLFAWFVAVFGFQALAGAPGLGWPVLAFAAAMFVVVPGLWLAHDASRLATFALNAFLLACLVVQFLLSLATVWVPTSPGLWCGALLLAGHCWALIDPETERVFERTRERRAERSAQRTAVGQGA